MHKKHNRHKKHDQAEPSVIPRKHHKRHKKENGENIQIDAAKKRTDENKERKHLRFKVRYNEEPPGDGNVGRHTKDKDLIEEPQHLGDGNVRRRRRKDKDLSSNHHHHTSPDKSFGRKVPTKRNSSEKIDSIRKYLSDVKKVNFEKHSNKNASSCSLDILKSKKVPLRKEKTIHIERDIEHHAKAERDTQKRPQRAKERETKGAKVPPQQVMYCQIETQPALNQDHVYPGQFYGDTRKRKHSSSRERPYPAQLDEMVQERKKRASKSKPHRHHRLENNDIDDNKKIKELFMHSDKRHGRVRHRKHLQASEPVSMVEQQMFNEEIIKSYFAKIQIMIDKKLEALMSSSKSKQKIRDHGKASEEKPKREHRPKSHHRHSEPVEVSRNSLSESSMHVRKSTGKHKDTSKEKRSLRRKSDSQERSSDHRRREIENDFRVQGIEPAERLQQQGVAPKRKPDRNLECKTVSIIGIPSRMQEKSIVLNHTQTSTSLKFRNSEDEMVEKKKKTKNFKLYYKYSLDRNACISDNSSERHSLLSDSCRIISVPSDESNVYNEHPRRHSSPATRDRARTRDIVRFAKDTPEKLPRRRNLKDTFPKLNNIVEERTNTSGEYNDKNLHCNYLNQLHSSNSEYSLKRSMKEEYILDRRDKKESDYYRHPLRTSSRSNNRNRRWRGAKFISKSDVNISYDSLCRASREKNAEPKRTHETRDKLKHQHRSDGENASNRACEAILNTLKEFSKEYKERQYENQMVTPALRNQLFDIVGFAESVKYFPELESWRNFFQKKTNLEKVIAVGKDNMTQTSLSLSVGIEAEKRQDGKQKRITDISVDIKTDIKSKAPLAEPVGIVHTGKTKNMSTEVHSLKNPKHVISISTETDIGRKRNKTEEIQQHSVDEARKTVENKKAQKQQKKVSEKKAVIYRYKKHGKIPRFSRDIVTETQAREMKLPKTYHCIALNTSFDRIDHKCVGLNTSFMDIQQRSSIDESDKSMRLSKSDTSLRNRLDTEPAGSVVASLTCLHKANEDKFTLSTKSNDQSLDHYGGKFIGEQPRTSRLFLTKDYKKSDIPAYQRRKSYDENIRKKLKKKSQPSREFAQQIFEVRFLQVDKLPKLKRSLVRQVDEACSPIDLHQNDQLFPICFERALVKSLREELVSQNIPYKLDIAKHPPGSRCSFSATDSLSSKANLPHKSKCETIVSIIDLTSGTTTTNGRPVTAGSSRTNTCEKDVKIQNLPKIILMNEHLSCPVLNHIDSSFDFLYETDSSSKENTNKKRPTILGFALKSETALSKVVKKKSYQKFDQISNGAPSSEESGYSSRKSCTSFFKQPFIAALMKPPSGVALHPNGFDVYNAMSQKCQEYAHKIRVHSDSKINLAQSYEEIPLDVLVSQHELLGSCDSHCCLTPLSLSETKTSSSTMGKAETESEISIESGDIGKNSSKILQEILEKKLTFSSTDLNKLHITYVDSDVMEFKKSDSQLLIENQEKLKKVMVKNFFENLLQVYEKEIAVCASLYEDQDFVDGLLDSVEKNVGKKSSKGKKPEGAIKRFVKKMFCIRAEDKEDGCYIKVERRREESEIIQEEHQKTLQSLAHYTRKYFSMYEQAVKINQDISDEMKTCGFLKLLDRIEAGQFTFLRRRDQVHFEQEIRSQVVESFESVYEISRRTAEENNRKLSRDDNRLICAFVSKYRIGLLSTKEIIGDSIGRGIIKTEGQLKDAVTYLLRLPNNKVDLTEFEQFCGSLKCST